jgi:LysM repeat protein
MATNSAEIQAEPGEESILAAIERRPLPAALLRIVPITEPEPSTTRWVWIVAGVAVLFGLVIGGNYLLSLKGRAPITAAVAPPTNGLGTATPPGIAPLPKTDPTPQLSVGQLPAGNPSVSDQTAMAPATEQSPVLSSGQPLQSLSSKPEPVQEAATAAAQSSVSAPGQQSPPMVDHETRYITVEDGQTLIRIAHANHVPAAAIAAANQLEPPYPLKAGSRLIIPDLNPPADQDVRASRGKTPTGPPLTGHFRDGLEPH